MLSDRENQNEDSSSPLSNQKFEGNLVVDSSDEVFNKLSSPTKKLMVSDLPEPLSPKSILKEKLNLAMLNFLEGGHMSLELLAFSPTSKAST